MRKRFGLPIGSNILTIIAVSFSKDYIYDLIIKKVLKLLQNSHLGQQFTSMPTVPQTGK